MSTRVLVGLWTLALLLAAGAAVLIFTSDHDDSPYATAALSLPVGLTFVGAGLIAWARRPENRVGRLLTLVGFSWFIGALAESNISLVFTLGFAFELVAFGFFAWLVLAFPSGKLETRLDRALVCMTFVLVTLGAIPFMLVDDLRDVAPDGAPANAFLISHRETLGDALRLAVEGVAVVLVLAIIAVVARRWLAARRPLRRALTPVYLTSAAVLVTLIFAIPLDALGASGEAVSDVLILIGLMAVPLAFLLGLLRGRLARAGVGRLLLEVPEGATLDQAQSGLRHALGDPTLQLAYWVPEDGTYVDTEGKPLELPPDTATRVTTMVAYEDRPVAALIHDAVLRNEPELLEQAVAAARIGLEKDRTLHELRQSEARNRALLAAMPDLMFRFSRDGTYLDIHAPDPSRLYNPSARMLGANIVDVLPADVAHKALESFARALAEGPQTVEYSLEIGGESRHFEGRVTASGSDEVVMIVRDVTENERQEEALRQSEARTSALLDAMPDLMFRIDREGRYLDFKADSEDHLATPASEVVGRRVFDRLPPEVAEPIMTVAQRALEQGGVHSIEYDLDLGGQLRHYEGRLVASGVDEVVMIVRDFTERRHLQDELSKRVDELQRERDLIRTVVDTAPTLFCGVDPEGRIVRFNRALRRLSGHTDMAAVEGRPFWEVFVAPDHAAEAERRFRAVLAGAEDGEHEDVWLTADGEQATVAWSLNAYTGDRADDRYLVTGTNITKRKRAEAKLQRLAEEQAALRRVATVVASQREPERIFEIVSHEASRVLGAQSSGIVRFEEDAPIGRIVGRWHGDGPRGFELGSVIPITGESALPRLFRTGQPTRMDGYENAQDEVGRTMHTLGFRSVVAAPVDVGGRLWGAVVVATTRPEPLPADTEQRLGRFAELVALALASADAREELIASRARIVEAGDAERRRLERNLHDGAQQRLVSLSLSLRLAQARLKKAPDEAEAMLVAAAEELSQALDDLRELARGIHPAVLTDRGLEPALEALAARSPVPIEIEAPSERLPQPVEATAYYVVSEALANVAKYAEASEVAVRVERADGRVVVEVEDDGVGGADPGGGTGLRGLADRVSALDGQLEVASPSGQGTRIRAEIPLPPTDGETP